MSVALAFVGVSRRFGARQAVDRVDLELHAGEIHALLGENGAGKSTLMKILYGYFHPDAGSIEVDGQPVQIHAPDEARCLGIGMVFQSFMLIPALSVTENVALALRDLPVLPSWRDIAQRIKSISDR